MEEGNIFGIPKHVIEDLEKTRELEDLKEFRKKLMEEEKENRVEDVRDKEQFLRDLKRLKLDLTPSEISLHVKNLSQISLLSSPSPY